MTDVAGNSPRRNPSRLRRRILWSLVALLFLAAVAIALLPSFIGPRALERLARGRINARVTAEGADFAWFGEQSIRGLVVGAPEGFSQDRELLRVGAVTVKRGLLGLLRGGEKIELEVDSPDLFVHRDAAGRFNFEAALGMGRQKEERRDSEGRGGEKAPPGKQPRFPEIPGLPLELSAVLKSGRALYVDDVLGTRSEVRTIEASLEGGPHELSLRLAAEAESGGNVQAEVAARPLGEGAKRATVDAQANVKALELRPYRGLIERLWGVLPPETPVNGDFKLKLGAESLGLAGSLDAGFLRVEKADVTLPIENRATANAVVAFELDLAGALASLRGAVPALADSSLAGLLRGSIDLSGLASLTELAERRAGVPPGARVLASLDGKLLEVSVAHGGRKHRLKADEVKASLRLEPSPNARTSFHGELQSPGINAKLDGTAGAAEARAPFEAEVTADVVLIQLCALLGVELPESLEVDPGTHVRVQNFKAAGEASAPEPIKALRGTGSVEVTGPIKAGGVTASNLTAELRAGSGTYKVIDLKASLNGGRATAPELTADFTGAEPTFNGTLKVEDAACSYELASLLAYVAPLLALEDREGSLEGVIAAQVELSGRGIDRPSLERSLAGTGSLRIRNGKIHGSRFFAEASRLLASDLGDVLFAEIGSDFKVHAGKVDIGKLFLVGREAGKLRNLGLAGVVGLDRTMDLGADLGSLQETIGDKKIQRVLKEARRILGDKGFPLRLRGTLSDPKLSLEASLESLPGLDRILEEVIKPAPGDAGGKKEDGLEDLLELFKKRKKRK